mgnify:CR=1 FL=1
MQQHVYHEQQIIEMRNLHEQIHEQRSLQLLLLHLWLEIQVLWVGNNTSDNDLQCMARHTDYSNQLLSSSFVMTTSNVVTRYFISLLEILLLSEKVNTVLESFCAMVSHDH